MNDFNHSMNGIHERVLARDGAGMTGGRTVCRHPKAGLIDCQASEGMNQLYWIKHIIHVYVLSPILTFYR